MAPGLVSAELQTGVIYSLPLPGSGSGERSGWDRSLGNGLPSPAWGWTAAPSWGKCRQIPLQGRGRLEACPGQRALSCLPAASTAPGDTAALCRDTGLQHLFSESGFRPVGHAGDPSDCGAELPACSLSPTPTHTGAPTPASQA